MEARPPTLLIVMSFPEWVELVTTWNWNGISDIYFTDLTEFQHACSTQLDIEGKRASKRSISIVLSIQ